MEDKEILELFRNGSENKAFKILMQKYQERMYYSIRRMIQNHDDADDVLQNAFIKAWTALKNFREDSSLYTWLYRIAINETLNFIEKSKRLTQIHSEKLNPICFTNSEGDSALQNSDWILHQLNEAISFLPEKQKLVFNLRYFDEIPYAQMEKILDTSEGALKASFHHAVAKIEEYLKQIKP